MEGLKVKKPRWSKEETDFLKKNYRIMTYKEIEKIIGRSAKTINYKARTLNLSKKSNKRWNEREEEYLNKYYGKIPAVEISKYLNRSFKSIVLKAFCLGLKTKPCNKWSATYNENFFDVWSSELAWLVGVVLSDGHISNIKVGKYVWVKMCDKDVLDKIKIILRYKGSVRPCKREKPHYKKPYIIVVGGKKIWQFFSNLGMDNYKSHNAKWPIGLPEKYYDHFLRGLFDGDGSIFFNRNSYPFARICGTRHLVESIARYINLHYTIHHNKTKTNYIIQYTGNRAKVFLNFIYEKSEEDIRMDRKYKKYSGVIE